MSTRESSKISRKLRFGWGDHPELDLALSIGAGAIFLWCSPVGSPAQVQAMSYFCAAAAAALTGLSIGVYAELDGRRTRALRASVGRLIFRNHAAGIAFAVLAALASWSSPTAEATWGSGWGWTAAGVSIVLSSLTSLRQTWILNRLLDISLLDSADEAQVALLNLPLPTPQTGPVVSPSSSAEGNQLRL